MADRLPLHDFYATSPFLLVFDTFSCSGQQIWEKIVGTDRLKKQKWQIGSGGLGLDEASRW
jgi:hypothetical protein